MKLRISLWVLSLGLGLAGNAFAGMLDDENANKPTDTATAPATSTPATATPDATTPATDAASQPQEAGPEEIMAQQERKKACDAAKAAEGTQGDGAVAEQIAAQKKCNEVDFTTANPVGVGAAVVADGSTPPARTMGSDAASSEAYYPPKNPVINGNKLSWAKIESFNQMMDEAGVPDNTAAAIAGNLQHESNAFKLNQWKWDPATGKHVLLTKYGASSQGDYQKGRYTSWGIAQYHDTSVGSGRGTDMLNFVGGKSLTPDGLQGTTNKQYEYLLQDMKKQFKPATYQAMMSGNLSVDQATQIFVEKYEIPALANSRYGRMGGTDRFNNALALQGVWNSTATPDGSTWGDTYVPGKNTNTGGGVSWSNSGLGNTISNALGGNTGALQSLLSQFGLGGNSQMSGIMGMLNGAGGTADIKTMLAQMLVDKIMGGDEKDEDEDEDSGFSDSSGDFDSSDQEASVVKEMVNGNKAIQKLMDKCGSDLPKSKDALMLMIKSCQALEAAK